MLLRASPSLLSSLSSSSHETFGVSSFSPSSLSFRKKEGRNSALTVAAQGAEGALTGVIFQPFQEVQKELNLVPAGSGQSLARQRYSGNCEAAINEQINVEYTVSYVYHSMFAYFDRDDVALRGLARFCKEMSQEERDHAEKLMEYQNMRGGKVKLLTIASPLTEFDNEEKGDALFALELALSFEKLVNEKLLSLHKVASDSDDAQMADFIESEFLGEQVESIKKISEYVSQLRRVGKGHGVWHFDQMLLEEGDGK